MEGCRIPVVWGLDKKYVLQAFVVMHSILRNSRQKFHFFILTASDIEEDIERFEDILKSEYSNFELAVRRVDSNRFSEARIYNGHLSKAAYFRLLIPEVILEYDKCIYLDCDVIVHGDLKELYEIGVEDYYLAGVKDCHVMEDTPFEARHQQVLGLPSRDKYINSGVLLMNLGRLRKDRMISRFWEQLKKENWFEDNDVLDVCCYPYIKTIPLKYNLFHFYLGDHIKFLYGLPYDKKEFDFDYECPFVLHMGADFKPWNSFSVKGSKEWWHLADIYSDSQSYHEYMQKCQRAENENEIRELLDKARKSEHIVIWGFGRNGKRLCDLFFEYQMGNVEAFVDNNVDLWSEEYRGIPVRDVSQVLKERHDILWVVSCRFAYDEIAKQLKDKGIDSKNILHYRNRYEDRMYLLSLAVAAYKSEIDKIADLEYVRLIPDQTERRNYIYDIIRNPGLHVKEYAYLKGKYNFQYWLETLKK